MGREVYDLNHIEWKKGKIFAFLCFLTKEPMMSSDHLDISLQQKPDPLIDVNRRR
jgi:hypothetical protein